MPRKETSVELDRELRELAATLDAYVKQSEALRSKLKEFATTDAVMQLSEVRDWVLYAAREFGGGESLLELAADELRRGAAPLSEDTREALIAAFDRSRRT